MAVIERYARNTRGRDYVVGDIHGMYSLLDGALSDLNFNPRKDRLFSVGDLVDRGTDSRRALEFVRRPWFHAVRGNHDQFVIDAKPDENWIEVNGGQWWLSTHPATRKALSRHFAQLPYVIEIETLAGTVGLVHADVPEGMDWPTFVEQVATDHVCQQTALWGRSRYTQQDASGVDGIWRIFCGHSITHDWQPASLGNVWFIDTGAWCQTVGDSEARLTVMPVEQASP